MSGGSWRVRVLDLSGAAEDGVVEEVAPFASVEEANRFARRYVRDSVERCRVPGMDADAVLSAWRAYGEDAEVVDAGEDGWRSEAEVASFAAERASAEELDWRSLDPRGRGDG